MLEKYQLRNGMKVILYPSTKSPVVTVQAWVKTGSADERKTEEGISHFIEHLLFKGTRKYKVGEIASVIEGSGGELNAYTSFDQTVFHITISKQFVHVAMDALSEMMGHPSFDAQEIDNEREVVIEEIKRSKDDPGRVSGQLLFSSVYQKHPYGVPVIGFEDNIRKVPRKTLVDYFQTRYSPSNMRLVIVGDFEQKSLKKEIDQTFGAFEPYKLRKVTRAKEPAQKNSRIKLESSKFQESTISLAWRCPSAKHADTPALDILALILGQGDSSRLTNRCRIAKPLVNYVGSSVYSPEDDGFFVIRAGLKAENIDEFLSDLGEEILNIQMESVSAAELEKAITIMEADEIYGVETVDGLARKLGTFELLFSRPTYYEEYLKKITKVTAADVLRVARKYLRPEVATVSGLIAAGSAKADLDIVTETIEKWQYDMELAADALRFVKAPAGVAAKKRPVKVGHASSKKAAIEKFKLANGTKLILIPNHQAPTVSVRAAFRGGQRIEPKGKEGIAEFLSGTWLSGTKTHTELELLETMDALAIAIRPFAGRNTCGLSLTTLTPNLTESLKLFFEVMREPVFNDDSVERERTLLIEAIKQKYDSPASVAVQNFQERMFEGHPYANDPSGTEATVKAIKNQDLVSLWSKMVGTSNLTLVAAGDFSPSAMKKAIEKELARLPRGISIDDKFSVKPIEKDVSHFEKLEKEQTHLVYGVRGLTLFDKDRHALQVMQSILAGQGGRLFLELRDKASLAYSVSPVHTDGLEVGYFGAYIGCSPEKVDKALEMMKIEFKKLVDTRVSDEELERAKRYLIGRHDIGLQRNSSLASAVLFEEVYGLDYQNVFRYAEAIQAVTSEQVQALARRLFAQHSIISVVGQKPLSV